MARSATETWIGYVALLAFFPSFLTIRRLALPTSWYLVAVLAVPAALIATLEAVFIQPARQSHRLNFGCWKPNAGAICYKLLGLGSIMFSIRYAQFILYEYSKDFYKPWFDLLAEIGPWVCLSCVLYVAAVDGFQTEDAKRDDMYNNLGRLLLHQPAASSIPSSRWAEFCREWAVKAFFLPLMTAAGAQSLLEFDNTVERLKELIAVEGVVFGPVYSTLYEAIFLVDVVWATLGYSLSCTLLGTQVRSVEPTAFGWAVALACYQPFNGSTVNAYLLYGGPNNDWQEYLLGAPPWCQALWGGTVLLLTGTYALSTVVFGLRFSNLTNRGIITGGPYALTRHPAYLSKNLAWWLVNVPWSTHDGIQMAFKRCVRLAAVNVLYAARAWTEEQHLLQDPDYVEYYNTIQQRYGLSPLKFPSRQQQHDRPQQHQHQHQQQGELQGQDVLLLITQESLHAVPEQQTQPPAEGSLQEHTIRLTDAV